MKRSKLRHLLIVLWMYSQIIMPLAHARQPNELRGMWIISPKPHDFFIETGVVPAEYPALVIDDSDTFRAYRFGITCASELTKMVSEADRLEPCMRQLVVSDVDRLTGLAIPIAEGRAIRDNIGWLLKPNHSGILADAITPAADPSGMVDGVPYHFAIFSKLFGEPLLVSVSENSLELRSFKGAFTYSFVRVSNRHLVGVGSLLNAVGLAYGQYFRCAMENIHDPELLNHAERIQEARNRQDKLYFDLLQGHSKETVTHLQSLRQQTSNLTVELFNKYANKADLERKFGAFAGCPHRDNH